MHKCRKCGSAFVTTCKFGFPRQSCESEILHPVEDRLKARKKIYEVPRAESEVKVNDYNPILFMLWKENIDIQFVSESSLALAHYVTGYVTIAEMNNMQDIWEEVGESKSIYSRLWSFGLRGLHSRECGLYAASDLVLGDHLCKKSCSVMWMDVPMPHKKRCTLKKHLFLNT